MKTAIFLAKVTRNSTPTWYTKSRTAKYTKSNRKYGWCEKALPTSPDIRDATHRVPPQAGQSTPASAKGQLGRCAIIHDAKYGAASRNAATAPSINTRSLTSFFTSTPLYKKSNCNKETLAIAFYYV